MIFTTLSSSSLFHSSISNNLIYSFIFYFHYCILQLFDFSLCFLTFRLKFTLLVCSFPEFIEHLYDINCFLHFHSFSEILFFFFIWNIFFSLLILPNSLCLFLCIRYTITFPKLEVFLHWSCHRESSSTVPLVTRGIYSRYPLCGLYGSFCCGKVYYHGCTGRQG